MKIYMCPKRHGDAQNNVTVMVSRVDALDLQKVFPETNRISTGDPIGLAIARAIRSLGDEVSMVHITLARNDATRLIQAAG